MSEIFNSLNSDKNVDSNIENVEIENKPKSLSDILNSLNGDKNVDSNSDDL